MNINVNSIIDKLSNKIANLVLENTIKEAEIELLKEQLSKFNKEAEMKLEEGGKIDG